MAKLVDLEGLKYFYSKIKAMLALKADDSAVVKSVNGTAPDASGNVSITVSGGSGSGSGGGVSTDTANTWTAAQTFGDVVFDGVEKRKLTYLSGSTIKPTKYMSFTLQSDAIITIDMAEIIAQTAGNHIVPFKIVFIGSSAPSLKFKNVKAQLLWINEFSPTKVMLLEGVAVPIGSTAAYILISVTSLNDGNGDIS